MRGVMFRPHVAHGFRSLAVTFSRRLLLIVPVCLLLPVAREEEAPGRSGAALVELDRSGTVYQRSVTAKDGPEGHEVRAEGEVVAPLEPDPADEPDEVLGEVPERDA